VCKTYNESNELAMLIMMIMIMTETPKKMQKTANMVSILKAFSGV
jgi:hypothetical protein